MHTLRWRASSGFLWAHLVRACPFAPSVPSLQDYAFQIEKRDIPGYTGKPLFVDATAHHNETAFANCTFGSSLKSNLDFQV